MSELRELAAVLDSIAGTKAHVIRHYSKFGESLRGLAVTYYGDAEIWEAIYSHNWHVIDNPMILQPGTSLVMPYHPKMRTQVIDNRLG